jgi:hypothetical protein
MYIIRFYCIVVATIKRLGYLRSVATCFRVGEKTSNIVPFINLTFYHLEPMTVLMYSSCIYDTPETQIEKLALFTIMTAAIYILNYLIS